MQLQEFIKQSLSQIVNGVREAQQELARNGHGEVNPHGIQHEPGGIVGRVSGATNPNWAEVQFVDFDVAVTVTESSETGGRAGISVLGIGAGAEKQSGLANSSVSRIQFKVPIVLPTQPGVSSF